jgi:hypothetical protein
MKKFQSANFESATPTILTHKVPKMSVQEVSLKHLQNNVRFEGFKAVAMETAVFWDIKTQFVPHSSQLMLCKI